MSEERKSSGSNTILRTFSQSALEHLGKLSDTVRELEADHRAHKREVATTLENFNRDLESKKILENQINEQKQKFFEKQDKEHTDKINRVEDSLAAFQAQIQTNMETQKLKLESDLSKLRDRVIELEKEVAVALSKGAMGGAATGGGIGVLALIAQWIMGG